MHSEWYTVPDSTIQAIARARSKGGRVIAVGTTSVRALESAAKLDPTLTQPQSGDTRLFIQPGFEYKVVDAMITNFHLPQSTLLMLVSAFIGLGTMKHAYQHAIKYRDNLLYHVRFLKGTTRLDLGIEQLAWSLKRTAEGRVLAAGQTWQQIGFGGDATYGLHIDLNDPRLGSELRSLDIDENAAQASFVALGEFEWLQENTEFDAVGPETVRGSSQGMPVLVVADQNQISP
jgi:hypothetical protein